MFSFLVARIKPDTDYEWFTFDAKKPVTISYRGTPVDVTRGTKFGVRPSTNKKQIRMIFKDEPTRVFTLSLDQAKKLARGVRAEGV